MAAQVTPKRTHQAKARRRSRIQSPRALSCRKPEGCWALGSCLMFALALALPSAYQLVRQPTSAPGIAAVETSSVPGPTRSSFATAEFRTLPPRPQRDASAPPIADELLARFCGLNPDQIDDLMEDTVSAVAIRDIPTILNALTHSADLAAAELRTALLRRWAETEPQRAAYWIAQLPSSPIQTELMPQVAIAFANSDLSAALHWLAEVPADEGRRAATLAVAGEAARTQPRLALSLACDLPPGSDRDLVLAHAACQWAASEPGAAADWARQFPDSVLRSRLISSVAVGSADPVVAANLAAVALPPGEEQERAAAVIAQRWAQHSPEAASAWINQFPASTTAAAPQAPAAAGIPQAN